MQALLARVGIDSGCRPSWFAPWNPENGSYVWFPIPDDGGNIQLDAHRRTYGPFLDTVSAFAKGLDLRIKAPSGFVAELPAHVDPDFDWLTYGDRPVRRNAVPNGRGGSFAKLRANDLIVFWAALQSHTTSGADVVTPALIGMFVVDRACRVRDVIATDAHMNAHTRLGNPLSTDVVVFGRDDGRSGRFRRAIPIGALVEGRHHADKSLVESWGLPSTDIHRSIRWLRQPEGFMNWLRNESVEIVKGNH